MTSYHKQCVFVRHYLAEALTAEGLHDIPANVLLAIAAHESGWGTSAVAKGLNNLHGITCEGGHRRFSSTTESFVECARLLAKSSHYASAREAIFAYEAECHHDLETDCYWLFQVGPMYVVGRNREELTDPKELAIAINWVQDCCSICRTIYAIRKTMR